MPKIDISERDLTQATGTVGTDIVYIPGFSFQVREFKKTTDTVINLDKTYYVVNPENYEGYSEAPSAKKTQDNLKNLFEVSKDSSGAEIVRTPTAPYLCLSVSDFEYYFGTKPVKFKVAISEHNIEADDLDRSYIMAKELLARGLPVLYHALASDETAQDANAISTFTTSLTTYLQKAEDDGSGTLRDVDEYSIKYITSGGYYNYGNSTLASDLLKVAKDRGDCVALIEADATLSVNPNSDDCFWNKVAKSSIQSIDSDGDEFGAAFTPWSYYTPTRKYNNLTSIFMPACFGYLLDLAVNIKTSPNWLAMAGTTRGIVPSIIKPASNGRISNTIANKYQPTLAIDGVRAINAITDIKPYGLTIWGNRTLKTIGEEGLTATNFLNTRNMISDIKKVAYRAAKAQLFEQNSETLWLNFKSEVSPFLEQLKKGNGISDYKLLKLNTKYDGSSLGKEEFACAIKIYPIYAVESFEITVVVSDNDVSVG